MKNINRIEELRDRSAVRVNDFRRFQALGMIPKSGDFFPSGVHYPPITMYMPITQEDMFKGYTMPADGLLDLYVHIPFCIRRCLFCHYPSLYGASESKKDTYLYALEKEMDIYMDILNIDKIYARSVLIGGGTPTDLTPQQLKRFLEYFCRRVDLSRCRQFNYDVDPSTLVGKDGIERLRIMRDYGVDRLTIGVQSFNDAILKRMNRSHDARTAVESVENSKHFGYKLNLEFIFGHPGQTLENWIEVLERALELETQEIQFYRLKVEPYGDMEGGIKKFRTSHPEDIPSNEEAILMKQIAIELLSEHGYHENLRRVYTKKRSAISLYAFDQCCQLFDGIGFGLTAFSSMRDRFVLNTQSFDEYYTKISESRLPLNRGLVRNKEQQIRWAAALPLKNYSIRRDVFKRATGVELDDVFKDTFALLKEYDLVREDAKKIEVTSLGAFFADEVVQQFFESKYMPFREEEFAPGPLNPYRERSSIFGGLKKSYENV